MPLALTASILAPCGSLVVVLSAVLPRPWRSRVPSAAAATVLPDAALAGKVHDQEVVATAPTSPAVQAWGDPAIIARCGVAALGPTTDQCIDVDGVGWVARQLSDGVGVHDVRHRPRDRGARPEGLRARAPASCPPSPPPPGPCPATPSPAR